MRQIQVLVPEEQRQTITDALDGEGFDYVRQRAWRNGEQEWLLEIPVPTDAVGYVLDILDDVGVQEDQYTVIASVETAMTPHTELLKQRFASDFDPLTTPELRSKAGDMSRDMRSFVALIFLSAIIATAGLLTGSPAVVVGSMVIAPIVGPVLTAAVSATTGDRPMLFNSIVLQATGLVVAVVGATAFSFALKYGGFVPDPLDILSFELVIVRMAPGVLSLIVGLAAGAAAAFGLSTKGPTSVIGVMIAAALIPAAATTGIATAWGFPRIAFGSLVLLVVTLILINLSALFVLVLLNYRPSESGWLTAEAPRPRLAIYLVSALALLVVVALVAGGTIQQVTYEREVNQGVESALASGDNESLSLVATRIEYSGISPIQSPGNVTVVLSYNGEGTPPQVTSQLEERIAAATDSDVRVRVRFVEYQPAVTPDPPGNAVGDPPRPTTLPTSSRRCSHDGRSRRLTISDNRVGSNPASRFAATPETPGSN